MELYNDNCLKIMQDLVNVNKKVDCIITDPPYGVNFKNEIYNDSVDFVKKESSKWLDMMYQVLNDNSHCYIYTGTKSLCFWLNNIEKSPFIFKNIVHARAFCNGQYLKDNFYFRADHIIYLSKGKAKRFNAVNYIKTSEAWLKDNRNKNKKEYTFSYPNFITDMFSNTKQTRLHPNEKNVDLLSFFVELSTDKGQIVLDPFMGSGSTGAACDKTCRDFIGVEINPKVFKIAKKRLQ